MKKKKPTLSFSNKQFKEFKYHSEWKGSKLDNRKAVSLQIC